MKTFLLVIALAALFVVPLLSASVEYDFGPRWTGLLDFDGLVGTQGRAIDAARRFATTSPMPGT